MSDRQPDTEHQAAAGEPHAMPRPSDDPQAVQVEKSGISAEESMRRRRSRNIALALALAAFVVLVFVITLVKLDPDVLTQFR